MSPGAAVSTPMTTRASRKRVSAGFPAVRSMRPSLTSKIHASPMTMGKPSAKATTTYESTASGQCSPCMTGSMICSTANAAMP